MSFEKLRDELKKENTNKKQEILSKIETEEGLKNYLQWERKIYKINPKEKLKKYLFNKADKQLSQELEHLNAVESASDNLPNTLIITIEWKRSYMWGSNPKAFDNYGNESDSIGGCGYDKLSTATAQILNQNFTILKALYQKKEDILKTNWQKEIKDNTWSNQPIKLDVKNGINRYYLGYGSGYGLIPRFEGGVGVDCHKRILEGLGYKMDHISNGKTSDVYRIYKKVV